MALAQFPVSGPVSRCVSCAVAFDDQSAIGVMVMSSRAVAFLEGAWAPVVGDFYAGLIARERVRNLKVAALIYLGAVLIDLGAVAVAVGLREVVLVLVAVAITTPTAVSLVLLSRNTSMSVGRRIAADLWSANVPVMGTMPSTRAGWASTWMHANRITPEQVEGAAGFSAGGIPVAEPARHRPRTLRRSVSVTLVGAVVAFGGLSIQLVVSARSVDSQLEASPSFVFLLTIALIVCSFSLTALCWLSRAIFAGSAAARAMATVLCAILVGVAVVFQASTQQAWVLPDIGLALCALSVGLAWTRSGSTYIRAATADAQERQRKVQARLKSIRAV